MSWVRTIVEGHYIMADLRKLQRNMSNALDKNNSCKRNTWFFFRILSSEEKLQLGKNKNKRKKRKCLPISDLKELPTELESECCFGVTHRRQMFVLVNFVLENNIVLTISDELHQSSKMDVYGGCVGRIECSNKPWILPLAWVERASRILARINGPYGFATSFICLSISMVKIFNDDDQFQLYVWIPMIRKIEDTIRNKQKQKQKHMEMLTIENRNFNWGPD